MSQKPRVILVGDANVDVVLEIDHMPAPGSDALAHSQVIGVGGSAANTAIMLQRLGVNTELVCCLGQDAWSEISRTDLAAENVGLTAIQRSATHPTSINVVTVTPDYERTMFAHRGASAQLRPDQLGERVIASAAVLYLSGYALLENPQRQAAQRALEIAHQQKIPAVLDVPVPAARQAPAELKSVIAQLEMVVIGLEEAEVLTGTRGPNACIDTLLSWGAKCVSLKLGAAGAILASVHERITIEGLAVAARDTTGAGDSFVAGAIYGLTHGWDLADIGALANAAGAAACQTSGAGRSLPAAQDVRKLINYGVYAMRSRVPRSRGSETGTADSSD